MNKHHILKTKSEYFWEVAAQRKTFEIRKDDRGFSVGDILNLAEIDDKDEYTGKVLSVEVTYIFRGPGYGLIETYCVMAIRTHAGQAVREEALYREL